MRKICAKFVPRVLREDQKERRCHDSREMVDLINSDPAVLDALVTFSESCIYCYDPETTRQNSQLKEKLRGCRYETIEEMKETVTKVIDTLTQEDFHGAFQKLLEWYKCIAAGGDYFEGD